MIILENLKANVLKVTAPESLKADDFRQITPQVDGLIQQQGKISLLLDASKFGGWENMAAFESHMGFVKTHYHKIERVAVIAGHDWRHWVAGMVRVFVHPEIRVYDKNQENEAVRWVADGTANKDRLSSAESTIDEAMEKNFDNVMSP